MSNMIMKKCKYCNKTTAHVAQSTSNILHLILSVITVGIWVPIWILVAMSHSASKQCNECGKARGLFE